jgi:molecular chaperone GrpE
VANARDYAATEFARDILGVADNLERALGAVPESKRSEHKLLTLLYDGVSMTQKGLASVLEKNGIKKIPTVGEKFNPHVHNALFELDDPEREPGTVAQVQISMLAIEKLFFISCFGCR